VNCLYHGHDDSNDCFKYGNGSCGWCGSSWVKGACIPGNVTRPTYAKTQCPAWELGADCFFRGKSDSDDCVKFVNGSCGWCGSTWNSGICVPGNKTGPYYNKTNCFLWEYKASCLWEGKTDSDDCTKIGKGQCGWCGNSWTEGICIMGDKNGPASKNITCKYWDDKNCLYKGRRDSDECSKMEECGWCGDNWFTGVCLSGNMNGPIPRAKCPYWDTQEDCMYKGKDGIEKCTSFFGCGWCTNDDGDLCLHGDLQGPTYRLSVCKQWHF